MRLLVTGATGFVGDRVVRLAERYFPGDVIGLARTEVTTLPAHAQVQADLLDPAQTQKALEQVRPTHLLHLAWDVTPGLYWRATANLEWLEASLRLFRLFAGCGGHRIVSVGTCAEYVWDGRPSAELATPLRPSTYYGQCKHLLGEALAASAKPFGVSWAWARLFWIYGPGERYGRLVSDLARAILTDRPFLLSSGLQKRDFMHVDDVARALLLLSAQDREGPFNVASGEAFEVRQIANCFAAALGRPDLLRIGSRPDAAGEAPVVVADVKRLVETGFQSTYDLQSGLRQTAEWWVAEAPEYRA